MSAKTATGPARRWWVSWYEPAPSGDYRPRIWPLPPAVPAYWCSGWRGDEAALCAVVDASDEETAKLFVEAAGWTPSEWRFCDEQEPGWRPPSDRFPWSGP
jgi:hypothetical protein